MRSVNDIIAFNEFHYSRLTAINEEMYTSTWTYAYPVSTHSVKGP